MKSVLLLIIFIKAISALETDSPNGFQLSSYDFLAFDIDNTLATYKLGFSLATQYKYMKKYLGTKNYSFENTLSENDFNLMQRGIVLDIKRGNLVKTSGEGFIFKATHGSKVLTDEEILRAYGKNRILHSVVNLIEERASVFKGKLSNKHVYTSSDFTDIIIPAIYAKMIDENPDYERAWLDMIKSVIYIYEVDSDYLKNFFEHINLNIHKTSEEVKNWLRELKMKKLTAAITGSDKKYADAVATEALGPGWKDLFHFVVYNASKPAFFNRTEPFGRPFDFSGEYSRGSYSEIEKYLIKKLGRKPKSVYFGDGVLNDLLHDTTDKVAIIKEAKAEGIFPGRPHQAILNSTIWGSFFKEGLNATVFGDIVMKTNFCAPDLDYFTAFPLNYTHIPFWKAT